MFSDDDDDDENSVGSDYHDKNSIDSDSDIDNEHKKEVSNAVDIVTASDEEIAKDIISDEENNNKDGSQTRGIRPWTICTAWDTCSIGTLPGYVS
jgi:hypothetical protein